MQALFAITILCFAGILWAALAFARHIKATHIRPAAPEPSPKYAFLPTIAVDRYAEPVVSIVPPAPQPVQREFREHFLTAPSDVPPRNSRTTILSQSVHDIAANKQLVMPPHATRIHRLALRTVGASLASVPAPAAPAEAAPPRKPPQPTRQTRMELIDPAYFHKDMGDLTDPQPSNNLRANDRGIINRY